MRDSQDTDQKIVFRKRWVLLTGWIMLLAAALLISFSLYKIASGEWGIGGALIISVLLIFGALGIGMAGATTTVTFNTYSDSITVTRGFIPIFLWWLRTKSISRLSVSEVRVSFRDSEYVSEYRVEIVTTSGKALMLFRDENSSAAKDLANRIRRWSGLGCWIAGIPS